jgi:beta-galactosidase
MCHASTVGQYTSTADAEYVPYIRPQEHGNHIETRELCVGGLTFTALGEQPFEFQVSRYSKEALTKADHTDELTADGNLHVRIDYKVSGIGSQSCGPALEPPYQLNEKEFTYGYRIHVS